MRDDEATMAPRLTLLAAAAAATVLTFPAAATAAPQQARSAASFVDSIGINIHSSFGNTPYNDHDRVLATLRDLGIRHVRDGLFTPTGAASVLTRQKAFRASLAQHGIKTQAIMGFPGENPAQYVDTVKAEGLSTLSGIEGPNEWDNSGRANWAGEVRAYQQALHAATKAAPGMAGVPVLGPSLAHGHRAPTMGDVSAWTDYVNIHAYPGGRAPGTFDDEIATITSHVGPGQTPIVTETGYHNGMMQYGGHAATSEAATATYLPRLFLDNYRRGIPRTFAYELINTHHDPTGMFSNYHFGLLRHDWSEKPVASTVRNLIRLVDPQPADVPGGTLDYALEGASSGVAQVLLRRADGSFAVVIWQTAQIWNRDLRRSVSVPARTVKLRTAAPADVSVGRVAQGSTASPVAQSTTATDVTIPGDDTVVVVVRPTGAPGTPLPEPAPPSGGDTVAPAPPPAPAPAPRKTVQQLWEEAMRNLARSLGLRSTDAAPAPAAAKTTSTTTQRAATQKAKAKKTKAKSKKAKSKRVKAKSKGAKAQKRSSKRVKQRAQTT